MYAGTQVSENFFEHNKSGGTLFKSTNGGQSWSAANNGLPDDPVQSLAVDSKNLGTVYAGTLLNGIFKSVDGGQNWAATNTGLTDMSVILLAVDPSNSSTIYAGTNGSIGFFKSTDAGVHWSPASLGFSNLSATSIAFDPTNPKTIYVGTSQIDSATAGFFRSTDGGQTWTISSTGLVEPPTGRAIGAVDGIAVDPTNPAVLYVAGGSVFKSVDGGQSWTLVALRLGVAFLFVDPATSSTLYAAGTGFFKSMDGAVSWNTMNSGLTDIGIRILAANPASPSTLYVGTGSDGAFKTTDGGQSWAVVNTGMNARSVGALASDPANPSALYAGSAMSLSKTVDAGVTWSVIDSGIDPTLKVNSVFGFLGLTVDPTDSNTVYAGGAIPTTLLKSTNAGQSWSPLNEPFLNDVMAVVVDPTASSTVYAGSTVSGVLKSTDGGQSWSLTSITSSQGKTVASLAMDPTNTAILYAGSFGIGGGVYKTTDGAQSWTQVLAESILSVAINPVLPTTVYAGNATGSVYKSTDAGQTWAALGPGLTDRSGNPVMVRTLAIDPVTPATIYAGTFGAGIIKSTDGGQTWSAINTGLPTLRILRLVIDQANPATIYAGTFGSGVFKTTSGGQSWQGTQALAPSIIAISPPSGTQGQTTPNFTVVGSNFDAAAVLSFSGTGVIPRVPYTSHSSTQIVTDLTIDANAPVSSQNVIVINPDGQKGTFPGGFSVVAPVGTINVTTNTPSATFTLTGPASFSSGGISATFTNAPPGNYTITYGAVAGYEAPLQQTQTLMSGGTIVFIGAYSPALIFPLKADVPDQDKHFISSTALLNSVFDHSMLNAANGQYALYTCDDVVTAFNGKTGRYNPQAVFHNSNACNAGYSLTPTKLKPMSLAPYAIYRGAGRPKYLFYDGHPGIDYRAQLKTQVYAPVTGTVHYPQSVVGLGSTAPQYHVMEIVPDHAPAAQPDYLIYYLHLATYKGQKQVTVIDPDPLPGCPASVSLPLPEAAPVRAGCLVALSGKTAPFPLQPHLHFEVHKVVLKSTVSSQFGADAYDSCVDGIVGSNYDCVPVDPYGWRGDPTQCDPQTGLATSGDPYQCLTGVASEPLWSR